MEAQVARGAHRLYRGWPGGSLCSVGPAGDNAGVEDTWWSRDLPVLDAAVKLLEGKAMAEVGDIARETGFDAEDVARALNAMQGVYIGKLQGMAVGQWPTPENVVERLAEAFGEAAGQEHDPERRSKLRAVAGFLGGTGKDLAMDVVAKVIAIHLGQG